MACAVLLSAPALAQTKPERQSKAAKAAEAKQSTKPAAAAANDAEGTDAAKPEDKLFKGMKYRLVGPFRGGRSLTAAGIPGDPTTYYFGATGGGVWKSTDGALTWSPVFDHEGTAAIGSIAVADRITMWFTLARARPVFAAILRMATACTSLSTAGRPGKMLG